ncbi:hypothetical protein Lser_V15G03377 [Lactuca serriola]
MLFNDIPGTGKTTTALAIVNQHYGLLFVLGIKGIQGVMVILAHLLRLSSLMMQIQ